MTPQRSVPPSPPAPSALSIVLLRAVNVGGATLPMAQLRAIAEELGATDVSTYIASGNLICAPPGDPAAFERALEAEIQARFGFFREAISRTPVQLQAALDAYPFDQAEPKWCHLYCLTAAPTPQASAALQAKAAEDIAVIGRDLHIHYRHGVGESTLTAPLIHRTLGVVGTGRNLATVKALITRAT